MSDGSQDGEGTEMASKSSRWHCRRPGSRLCHCLLGVLFFLMMVFSLAALGVFAAVHNKIKGEVDQGDSDCILYTTTDQLDDQKLSRGEGCRFTIWGNAVVAVGAGLFMLGYLFKTVYGAALVKCWVCVELPLFLLLMVASLAISINTSLGLALACMAFDKAKSNDFFQASGSECKDYKVTTKKIKFFDNMVTSDIISWSITGALLFVVVLYVVLIVVFCRRRNRSDEEARALLERAEQDNDREERERKSKKRNDPRKKYQLHARDVDNPFLKE